MEKPFGKISIIGAGNVAFTLCRILNSKGLKPFCLLVRNADKINGVRSELAVDVVSDYKKIFESDLAIIAVNDDSILEVADNLNGFNGLAVHTSGTMPSQLLSQLSRYGVFYPLQTMSKVKQLSFDSTPILINANNEEDALSLTRLGRLLSDSVFNVDDERRKVVHLSAVFVSNFTNVMLGIGDKILRDNGLPLSIMKPLVFEMMEKCFAFSPTSALTGPAKRHDISTINSHIDLLSRNYPEEAEIYKLITKYVIENNKNNEKL
ncbi:MAG: Rossmann-like and DUF2520 domain-containing protein [Candidatus Limimorpha sp.]